MEFKIAVIGKNVYGDVGLIAGGSGGEEVGFHDDRLKQLLQDERFDKPLNQPIVISDSTGHEQVNLTTLRQLAH